MLTDRYSSVSVLFNEPKLLKKEGTWRSLPPTVCFSALQRAEIAEMHSLNDPQRKLGGFSALQRAEIAEIYLTPVSVALAERVSVLFNEPKLLKS